MNKKKGFVGDIEKQTLRNKAYRKVIYTAKYSQLVLMSLLPKEEIGMEVHSRNDQFFRFESGKGKCIINGKSHKVKDGSAIIIPAGAKHNIINTSSKKKLKIYTIYSPPHHEDRVFRLTKKEADSNAPEFKGATTE